MAIPPLSPGPAGAIAAAARGLHRVGTQAADAAGRVATAGAPRLVEDGSARAALEATAVAPDLARGMVDLLLARQAYAANAAVMRSADEMAAELVRRTA
ncbi:flagellar basal body rod C-terminal domain-containing protein [Falsiroseomonas sp.]|uniref:flagellar basal body rod C-terminal domain-containing protein n=1 Tax=Falsiroseomonas sp. TaxID=2870721 RepID=UPI0035633A3D